MKHVLSRESTGNVFDVERLPSSHDTVDGFEILHQLMGGKHPMVLFRFQPSKLGDFWILQPP